ncbi:MAG: hypothetical protein WDZ42_01430 [Candidatus Saccharimonadales bacterium]
MFSNKESSTIKLKGDIDISSKPMHIHIHSSTNDLWKDFSYWLEAISFLAHEVQKDRGWSKQQIEEMVAQYLDRALDDVVDDSDSDDNSGDENDSEDSIDLKDIPSSNKKQNKKPNKKLKTKSTKKK